VKSSKFILINLGAHVRKHHGITRAESAAGQHFTAADHVPFAGPGLPPLVLRRIRVSVWPAREGTWRLSERTLARRDRDSCRNHDLRDTVDRMSSATQQRDRAAELAKQQPEPALHLARAIEDPWFRCQALSHVARYLASEAERSAVLTEAFLAGSKLGEPNRVTTVSAWPLKVLAITGQSAPLEIETERLLAIIATESSPVRRADALYVLGGAVIGAGRELVLRVLRAFISACLQPLQNGKRNRKGESLLVSYLPAIQRLEPNVAQDLLGRLTPAHREQARSRIAAMQQNLLSEIIFWPNV